ncbi:MAG: hypothetical protein ACI9F9_001513, partial [Candidatus Paceibacteria bacterium]
SVRTMERQGTSTVITSVQEATLKYNADTTAVRTNNDE